MDDEAQHRGNGHNEHGDEYVEQHASSTTRHCGRPNLGDGDGFLVLTRAAQLPPDPLRFELLLVGSPLARTTLPGFPFTLNALVITCLSGVLLLAGPRRHEVARPMKA
jgi:hypothetical protein